MMIKNVKTGTFETDFKTLIDNVNYHIESIGLRYVISISNMHEWSNAEWYVDLNIGGACCDDLKIRVECGEAQVHLIYDELLQYMEKGLIKFDEIQKNKTAILHIRSDDPFLKTLCKHYITDNK